LPNSDSQVPAITPTIMAMTMATAHMITDPTIAFSSPPLDPVEGVDMVKMSRLKPAAPLRTKAHRMTVSAVNATTVAIQQKIVKTALAAARRERLRDKLANLSPLFRAKQEPGDRQHCKGHNAKHDPKCDQRGAVHGAGRLVELVGDRRGDC